MEIIDLSEETKQVYFTCLEEWSDEIRDGVCRKKCWYDSLREKGLRVKLARNEDGVIAGMIQYAPIEYSWVEGENLYFVYCVWVHGHKQGRGDLRKKGAGTALLRAAEDDVRELGAGGLVVWGVLLPFFMRSSWFRRKGYKKADRKDISVLLWKPFSEQAVPPRWIRAKKKPEPVPGKVVVTALAHGWCSGTNGMVERAKTLAAEYNGRVVFREIDVSQRDAVREWGMSDGLFVDGKNVYTGPPLTRDQIKKILDKRVRKLGPEVPA